MTEDNLKTIEAKCNDSDGEKYMESCHDMTGALKAFDTNTDSALAGFFMGEGCLDLYSAGGMILGARELKPRARVSLRADDVAVLGVFQSRFGGAVVARAERSHAAKSFSPNRSPIAQWTGSGVPCVRRLVEVLLRCSLPCEKMRQVKIMAEAIPLFEMSVLDRQEPLRAFALKLKEAKRYPRGRPSAQTMCERVDPVDGSPSRA